MLIVAHQTTPLKVKSVATLGGKETSFAGNVMLAGHMKLRNLMKDFIVCLRWVTLRHTFSTYYNQNIQPGHPHSAEETILDVEHQVQLACLGISQNVKTQQTKTGIKDAYTQYWIDHLIEQARTLHKEHPRQTTADIQSELLAWVQEHKSEIYNPFLKLDGKHFPPNFAVVV